MSFVTELKKLVRDNIRDYGMFIALIVIVSIFTITTNGIFLSSRNISNLINQTGYVAVLAIGITIILIIRHIDLSIGYAAGFTGAVSALLMTQYGLPGFAAILVALFLGLLLGIFNGTLVAHVGVPAFVVTLAGMMIFRGLLLLATEKTGTINVTNDLYNAIGNGFIPDIVPHTQGVRSIHMVTIMLGLISIAAFIVLQLRKRNEKKRYQFEVSAPLFFMLQLLLSAGVIFYLVWTLANYNGFSYTTIITAVIALLFSFIMSRTKLGRHIYGLGGNPEAAELSGVNLKRVTTLVFVFMGVLSALAGVMYTSRLRSAAITAGAGFEMDAIASAFVGGVSSRGGVGKISGSIIGALVMSSLSNGMALMNTGIYYQYIIRGTILVLAVIFDITSRRAST
jgi:putative multiple sugar transport system permease protein